MKNLLNLCIALSLGIFCGGLIGIITKIFRKQDYTEQQQEKGLKMWKTGSKIMTVVTCLFLVIGFIWCLYFLILGIMCPSQSEYANNMSSLIVSVLTIVSIAFAFYEFIRKK